MSGFTEYQASGASDLGGRADVVLTWNRASSMLPLVRQIVGDVLEHVSRLSKIEPEKDRLDRHRHDLVWLERQRRYQLTEEATQRRTQLQAARAELDALGVVLLDEEMGLVGFPTLVNNQKAYFTWKPGEETLDYWQFADTSRRRPVPPGWKELEPVARRNR
jgi:hypothetical protein